MDLLQKSGETAPDYWSAPGVLPALTSGGTVPALRWSIGFNSPETDCKCLPWNGKEQKGTRKRQVRNKIFSINSNVSISYEQ